MNIIQQIDKYLNVESLRSRELFSRFDLLVKQEKWYYTSNQPAPPGVPVVEGERGGKKWNASMARAAGVSEADIASYSGDKSVVQMAEARAAAQPAIPESTPIDSASDDVFEDWQTFTATHRRITNKEKNEILAQQKAAGHPGTALTTPFPEPVAVVNKEGKVTHATTMDGRLIQVFDNEDKEGKILRRETRFNTSATAKYQATFLRAKDTVFNETGKNELRNGYEYSFASRDTSAGKKLTQLTNLSEVYDDVMSRVADDLQSLASGKKPKPVGDLSVRSIQEGAFAIALIDHTFKRIGSEPSHGSSKKPWNGREMRPLSINKKANAKELKRLKKAGKKFSRDSKGRIFLRDSKGRRGKDQTKYDVKPIKTYAISNFRAKHIKVDAQGNVRLQFLGKGAEANDSPIKDKFLAAELIKRKAAAEKLGKKANDKTIVDTTASTINKYLKLLAGSKDVGAHKFRTYHATRLAREAISSIGDAPTISTILLNKALKKEKNFENLNKDEKSNVIDAVVRDLQLTKMINSVGSVVAPNLAHSAEICIQDYIDDSAFEDSGWTKQFDAERKRLIKEKLETGQT